MNGSCGDGVGGASTLTVLAAWAPTLDDAHIITFPARKRAWECALAVIERVELCLVNLEPEVARTDAIQAFVSQETPLVTIINSDGAQGMGYSYTIGTGGSAVIALLRDTLAPLLIGSEASRIEAIWRDLRLATHATQPGAITALALAAIDTALWDLRCRRAALPLHIAAGGAKRSIPVYSTEGGWVQIDDGALVDDALAVQARGFKGCKIKVGKPYLAQDVRRLAAVREAVGDAFEIFTDANQAFSIDEAKRRARAFEALDIGWFEEPLPSDDIQGHVQLVAATTLPIAVGESIYSIRHFADYLQRNACSIVQVDVARVGGITPWLKVAHMAEALNLPVCPHFLMELHLGLCCAVPNARWLEYIPQLGRLAHKPITIREGEAMPSNEPGLGIAFDRDAIARLQQDATIVIDNGAP